MFYKSNQDIIHLTSKESFKNEHAYYAVALHEIGHATGHSARLNRKLGIYLVHKIMQKKNFVLKYQVTWWVKN